MHTQNTVAVVLLLIFFLWGILPVSPYGFVCMAFLTLRMNLRALLTCHDLCDRGKDPREHWFLLWIDITTTAHENITYISHKIYMKTSSNERKFDKTFLNSCLDWTSDHFQGLDNELTENILIPLKNLDLKCLLSLRLGFILKDFFLYIPENPPSDTSLP